MAHCLSLLAPLTPSLCSSSPLGRNVSERMVNGPELDTILNLSYAGLEVVQRQVADLITKAVEIHLGLYSRALRLCKGRRSVVNGRRWEGRVWYYC